MTRSGLLLSIAGVLAGTAALFVVLGTVFNLILLVVAVPFGLAAYFLWSHATGRLQGRIRQRVIEDRGDPRSRTAGPGDRTRGDGRTEGWQRPGPSSGVTMGREEALDALDLSAGADQGAIRRAYRARVKAVHPDAEGGDEDEFRRVRAAYERLRSPARGKG